VIFTAQDIVRNFESRDSSRGKLFQAEGHVKEITLEKNGAHIEALVQDDQTYPYRVSVDVRKIGTRLEMETQCSCPVGYLCKHAAAALYEAIAEENRQHERLRRPTDAAIKTTRLSGRLNTWLAALDQETPTSQTPGEDRVIYILGQEQLGHMPHLCVTPALQHKMQSGEWGHPRAQSFQQLLALNQFNPMLDAADQSVFSLVSLEMGSTGKRFTSSWLPPTDPEIIDLVMRRLIATGRVFLNERAELPLVLGPEHTASLDWELLPNKGQKPNLKPDQEGLNLLLSRSPWYVSPITGEAGPLRCAVDSETLFHFLSGEAVNEKEAAILRDKLKTSKRKIPRPYKLKDALKGKSKPKPLLQLVRLNPLDKEANIIARAFLRFAYPGQNVHPHDPATHYQEQRDGEIVLYERDRKAEEKALATLGRFGLSPCPAELGEPLDPRGLGFAQTDEAAPWFWLDFTYDAAAKLRDEGFEIDTDSSFRTEIIEPDNTDIDASFTQNGDWWFALDLGITLGGQRIKLLPLLVAMIRRLPSLDEVERLTQSSKCYVPLPDGRQIALPAERIQTILKTLVELFDPKALDKDGQIQVSMDLAAAFVKLEAITRKRWLGEGHLKTLVEKLGDFSGIEQIPLPKGLAADLRPYQLDGFNWLHFLHRYGLSGILADDMGLGKTIQALAYLLSLKEHKKLNAPCLIVMPTSLIANWESESAKFTPALKTMTLHGRERLKRFDEIPTVDVVFTTYPLLPRDIDILREQKWALIILDEAQAIKNPTAKMTQAACALQAGQRMCLTGTPVENHLGEAWSLFTFLMPGLLGDHKSFTKHYRTPIERDDDTERKDLLAKRLRPFVLRRLKTEVAKELPPKTEMIRRVTLADDQRDLYEAVRHVMNDKVRDEIAAKGLGRSHIVILDALLKLRQTCCDPRLVKLEAAKKVTDSAKLEELMTMLPTLIEEGRKILLFSQFTSMLDLIKPELKKIDIPFVELRGSTKDRATPIKQFQKGDVPLFLISLKAGGTGLNLTAADTVIHYDPWWNPSVENQATDRAHRIGQDKPVFVYKLIAEGTVEERILELQSKKSGLAAALFGDSPGAAAKLSPDDLKWLMGG